MNALEARVAAEVRRRGPIPFSEVVDLALYDPEHGFYATGGAAGRRGDFVTSPEVGPLFGAVIASAIDGWWRALGEPDRFVVVEAGAGPGTLAVAVLRAKPDCAPALRYVLVERTAAQRARHAERLALESPAFAFAPDRSEAGDDEDRAAADLPAGPIVVSLEELPRMPGPNVVLANELLDNLPFDVVERRDGAWHEVRVALDGDRLVEQLVPCLDPPPIDAPDGTRLPRQRAAAAWVRDAVALAGGGPVVAFDYAAPASELAQRPWLRTFRGHERGGDPLAELGSQDITADVCVDQLPAPATASTQADWLRRHGLDVLVDEGRAQWEAHRTAPDVAAIAGRSRAAEAEVLTDPAGLGGFTVLEWR